MTTTYTTAMLEVSRIFYDDVRNKLIAAGYDHAVNDKDLCIDMHGISLTPIKWERNEDEIAEARVHLDTVTKKFEAQGPFKVYPIEGNHALSATGEEYFEVVSAGMVPDGSHGVPDHLCKRYPTASEAIVALDGVLHDYAASVEGENRVLYWRMRPEIDQYEGKWKTYCRLLISAKPALYPALLTEQEQIFRFPAVYRP